MKFPGKRSSSNSGSAARDDARRRSERSADDAQSEEVLRNRARRRLIGAVVLVMTGVVLFPLVFETSPKPVTSSMTLVVPPQSQASAVQPIRPASVPAASQPVATAQPTAKPTAVAVTAAATSAVAATPSAAAAPTAAHATSPQAAAPAAKPVAKTATAAASKPAAKPAGVKPQTVHAAAPSADARAALAALSGKNPDQISSAELAAATQPQAHRFVVQAGAFAGAHSAMQLRHKIEAAGYKSYTQVLQTHDGQRWRVRVGPFADRRQADAALAHLKSLGVHGAVLGL